MIQNVARERTLTRAGFKAVSYHVDADGVIRMNRFDYIECVI